jgi:neutral ceramidase
MRIPQFGCAVALACLAGLAQPSIASADWKAGFAHAKITPEQPIFLSGYASRNKPYTKVLADIHVKALVLEDDKGHRAVLVTSDLIGFRAAVAEPICERICKKLNLQRAQVLLNSSHTHTGPMLGITAAALEGLPPGDAQRTIAYTRLVQDKVVDVVVEASAKLEPVKLSWGDGVVHFVMNRREFTPNGVILGVNPRGLADRGVPVLRIDSPAGKLRAVVFGAAAHNTTLTGNHYDVSGDYAGFAQSYVQEKFPGVQTMFMLGCAGDANPYPRGTVELVKEHGATLGKEVCRVLESKLKPVRGPVKTLLVHADLPLQEPPARDVLEKQAKGKGGAFPWVAQQMLKILDRGEKLPTHYRAPIALWQFGDDLSLVALSGEVVVDYLTMVEKALGPNRLWVAGYCNDVFGYLPSARVLGEGGYETRGLIHGGIGLFAPHAQDVVIATVRNLAKQAGRSLP